MSQPINEDAEKVERRSEMTNLVANLAILNERLGNVVTTFEKQTVIYDKRFEAHENRILSVERFQMKIVGAFAIISVLLQLGFNVMNTMHMQQFSTPTTISAESAKNIQVK